MLKNKLQIYVKLFFIVAVMSNIVSSCSIQDKTVVNSNEHPEFADQNWLSSEECSSPCWHGLEIGISSRDDTIATIQNLSFIQRDNFTTSAGQINFLCKVPSSITCVSASFDDEILTSLRLYLNYQIALEQVVNEIGVPDSFVFSYRSPESLACDITLFWEDRQMSIDTYYDGRKDICESFFVENGKFPQEMSLDTVNYMTSTEMEMYIEDMQTGTGYIFMLWDGFVEE